MIRYIDIVSLRLFGGGGFNLNLAKRCHSTTRADFECIRAGSHCVSQRHILRGRLLENSSPLEFPRRRIDQINYSIVIYGITLLIAAVFDLWL